MRTLGASTAAGFDGVDQSSYLARLLLQTGPLRAAAARRLCRRSSMAASPALPASPWQCMEAGGTGPSSSTSRCCGCSTRCRCGPGARCRTSAPRAQSTSYTATSTAASPPRPASTTSAWSSSRLRRCSRTSRPRCASGAASASAPPTEKTGATGARRQMPVGMPCGTHGQLPRTGPAPWVSTGSRHAGVVETAAELEPRAS